MADLKSTGFKTSVPAEGKDFDALKRETEGKAASANTSFSIKSTPTHEEISALAYQLWLEGGSIDGSHEEDWHRAEEQLKAGSLPRAQAAKA